MSVGRRLVGDTLVYGFALGFARTAAFLLVPVFTRLFTPPEYGVYDVVTALSRALLVPSVLGMDVGMALLFRDLDGERQRVAASSSLAAQLGWTALVITGLVAFAPEIASILLGDRGDKILIVLGAGILAMQVWNNFVLNLAKWRRDPRRYLTLTLGAMLLASALSVAVAVGTELRVLGALLGLVLGGAIFVPVGAWLVRHYLAPRISSADMRECLRFGLPFAANNSADLALPFLLRLAVIAAVGLGGVGIFGATLTLCSAVMLISDAVGMAWWPYALSPEARARVHEDTSRMMRVYAFALALVVAVMLLAAEPLTLALFGGGAFSDAAPLIGPLAFAFWLKSIRQNASVGLVVVGASWLRAAVNLAAMAAATLAAFPLAQRWGGFGAAAGFIAGEVVGLGLQSWALRRFYRVPVDLRTPSVVGAAIVALMLAASALALAPPDLAIGGRLGLGLLFPALLLMLGVVRVREICQVAGFAFASVKGVSRPR